jgi:hypothetical protein
MKLTKAMLKSFNATNYTADIQLAGSFKTSLKNIAVARNLSSAEMTAGRQTIVLFLDEYISKDALIIAVYG